MTRLTTNPIPKLLAAAAIAALALTGCGIPDRVVHLQDAPTGDATVGAPLREESATRIATRVLAEVANASTSEEREAVMTGPALRVHNYRAARLPDAGDEVPDVVVPQTPVVLAVSNGPQWPRAMLVTSLDASASVQHLHVLVSDGPTDQFRLHATAPMLPGTSIPSLGELSDGVDFEASSEDAPIDASATVDAYAKALAFPSPQESEAVSVEDPFAQSLRRNAKAQDDSFGDLAGLTQKQHGTPGSVVSVETADGGRVIFGQLVREDIVTLTDKAKELKISDPTLRSLLGKEVVTSSVNAFTLENLVFVVRADGPATLIGAEEIVARAEGT